MTAQRNEHVVAVMIEPVMVGQEFIEWPLHITVVPWFPGKDEEKIDEVLTEIAKDMAPFSVKVGQLEMFGPKKDVPVNLVEPSADLEELHLRVLNALESHGMHIHQKDFVGDGYRAHITHQQHGKKQTGEQIQISSFTLVRQIRLKKIGTMVKTIAKTYELG